MMSSGDDRLDVLFYQESLPRYRTTDYLAQIEELASSMEEAKGPMSDDGKVGDQAAAANANGSVAPSDASSRIDEKWREKISEWAYQVADFFDASREVVSIAMNMLDRCMADSIETSMNMSSRAYQLEAMTCLYLAIKLNEFKYMYIKGSKSSMDTMLQLSRGGFTVDQMERMEVDVLRRLQWHVNPPTPQLFLHHFLPQVGHALGLDQETLAKIHGHASFILELSVMDYFFVQHKPSEVTRAALALSIEFILGTDDAHVMYAFDANVDWDRTDDCMDRLNTIYRMHNLSRPQPDPSSDDRSPSPDCVADDIHSSSPSRGHKRAAANDQSRASPQQQQRPRQF